MAEAKKIKTALVSVFHKDGLEELLAKLNAEGVKFLSTGGTQKFIESLGYQCEAVENVTTYPSILGGRVKTLHPKIFGGILGRRELQGDLDQMAKYEIPEIDLVIVDLYPFEQTVASGASEADIIEKIDIGGISLIRAGAKNFKDVVIVPSKAEYSVLLDILKRRAHRPISKSVACLLLAPSVFPATTTPQSTSGSSVNFQLSIINSQFSILNSQLSILNFQFSILNSQLSKWDSFLLYKR